MTRHIEGAELSGEMLGALAELLRTAFGAWPPHATGVPAEQHLSWMLRDFPPGARVVVAEHGSRLVGTITVLSRVWWLRGRPILVRDGVNLAIAPDFQGQGLYRLLRAYCAEHLDGAFDLRFGYLTVPASRHIVRTDGAYHEPANRVRALLCPFDPAAVAAEWVSAHPSYGPARVPLAAALRAAAGVRRARRRPRAEPAAGWQVRTAGRLDPRIDSFCGEARTAYDFIQVRDQGYLTWRYLDPRSGGFTLWIAEEGERILGYAASCVRGERGYLADLLALPGRIDVAGSLLDAALGHLRGSGATGVLCWLTERHPYAKVLRSRGFLVLPTRTGALYRRIRLGSGDMGVFESKASALHVLLGDSDHI